MLETEIVKFRESVISRRKWRKYIPNLRIDNHGYDVDGWVDFLDKLRDMMLEVKIPVENKELLIEAKEDIEKLELTIDSISLSPDNWIVCMSATILDSDTFCRGIGLEPDGVKVIRISSDFPLKDRPIYPLNVAYLNYGELQKDAVKRLIASVIDRIMTQHKDHKGIIHTTSYEQLNFIRENVSKDNRRRLLETDPEEMKLFQNTSMQQNPQ